MVLDCLAEAIGIAHVLADPEVVVNLGPAGLGSVRRVAVQLEDTATAVNLGVDQLEQVGDGPIVGRRFLEGEHLVLRGGLRPGGGVGHVAPVVIETVEAKVVEQPDSMGQQVGASRGSRGSNEPCPSSPR